MYLFRFNDINFFFLKIVSRRITAHTAYRQDDGTDSERDPRVHENFAAPKNGIESLLQASAFTGPAGADNQLVFRQHLETQNFLDCNIFVFAEKEKLLLEC